MKIVIVNKSAEGGGAAVAAKRLYEALDSNGMDVKMLVQDAAINTINTQSLSNTKKGKFISFLQFIAERLYFLPFEKDKSIRYGFSPAAFGADISKHPFIKEADIIHLHWVNHGFLSLKSLDNLFKLNKPIVWTLHDMWPFTGGCHYAGACFKYIDHCGFCPFLKKPHKNDLSTKIHAKKYSIWKNANINAISCSKWLGSLAEKSSLFQKKKVLSIPNPINTTIFSPQNTEQCRKELGLPQNKKLLLFGAANITDPRKGIRYLMEALSIFKQNHPNLTNELELVVFGKSSKSDFEDFAFKTHCMEFISNTSEIVKLYNATDAFILPSLQDNLPNTVMESLACGVPVIGFKTGGVPEMIDHMSSGYLADFKDSESLAAGIFEVIFTAKLEKYKEAARIFTLKNYDNKIVSDKYIQLYSSLINKNK